jgi:hypothetical protein
MITNSTTDRAAATTPSSPVASGQVTTHHGVCCKRTVGAEVAQ